MAPATGDSHFIDTPYSAFVSYCTHSRGVSDYSCSERATRSSHPRAANRPEAAVSTTRRALVGGSIHYALSALGGHLTSSSRPSPLPS